MRPRETRERRPEGVMRRYVAASLVLSQVERGACVLGSFASIERKQAMISSSRESGTYVAPYPRGMNGPFGIGELNLKTGTTNGDGAVSRGSFGLNEAVNVAVQVLFFSAAISTQSPPACRRARRVRRRCALAGAALSPSVWATTTRSGTRVVRRAARSPSFSFGSV